MGQMARPLLMVRREKLVELSDQTAEWRVEVVRPAAQLLRVPMAVFMPTVRLRQVVSIPAPEAKEPGTLRRPTCACPTGRSA